MTLLLALPLLLCPCRDTLLRLRRTLLLDYRLAQLDRAKTLVLTFAPRPFRFICVFVCASFFFAMLRKVLST